ncbi:MAG TPA: MarR family transcriptional regulator [Nitrososphaera sp.]|nr:MarR family transcriptional regulator [Nitrososphaera sp.]
MSSVRINESPNHFMVLDAIGRGVKTIDKIAKVIKMDKAQVELIVNDLITQRLAIRTEKKGFLGRTKIELTISHTGLQVLNVKKQELEKQWQQVQQWYNNGQTQQVQGYMDNNRMWIPMMLSSGIMNAMFFMSMMSIMGMALSPAESGLVGGEGAGAATADSGDAAGADDGSAGADSGGADTGGTDFGGGGDFGGGDFSF